MSLRQTIFNYIATRHPHTASFRNFNEVKDILVIFESDLTERHLQIHQLMKELQEQDKHVVAWGFVPRRQPVTLVLRDFRVLGQKDLDLLHRPKKQLLQELQRMHFDLVIDLTTDFETLPLRYINLYANADFRTGKAGYAEPYIHDFMIDLPEENANDTSRLFDQIIHYLKIIQSK